MHYNLIVLGEKLNCLIPNKTTMGIEMSTKSEENTHNFPPMKTISKRNTPLKSSYSALLDYSLEHYNNRGTERRDRKYKKARSR